MDKSVIAVSVTICQLQVSPANITQTVYRSERFSKYWEDSYCDETDTTHHIWQLSRALKRYNIKWVAEETFMRESGKHIMALK